MYEARGRTHKALSIVGVVDHLAARPTAAEVDMWPESTWALACLAAGVRPASVATRAVVVAILADRETHLDMDPFEGLV